MPRFRGRIPDPRPSRAHPEQRKLRKELEKEHGYGWLPPVILALLGVTLAYDVTKDVEKHEGRHKQREEEEEEERKRRKRQRETRSSSHRHRRRSSYDEAVARADDYEDADDDYYSRDGDRDRRRRDRGGWRRDELQQWAVPDDDIDVHNDHEAFGGGRETGLERADSLERGEVTGGKMDGGLDKADQLEKGEGSGAGDDRPRRSIVYDDSDQGRRYRRRRRRRDDDLGYEYLDYSRGREVLDEPRSRPRPRRRSSDW